ncbi:MAG: PQQ-binding-like beta-propeller repeat protein [Candidatus Coatesbacteria bacterium]|nr:PQQ-binding-like beta-propeller repeat protein [Candidatus Coatesbacteria bacterium]
MKYLVFICLCLSIIYLHSAPGDLIWKYKTGDYIVSSPCVSDGVVYVASGLYLYAIKTASYKYLSRNKTTQFKPVSSKSSFSLPTKPEE